MKEMFKEMFKVLGIITIIAFWGLTTVLTLVWFGENYHRLLNWLSS